MSNSQALPKEDFYDGLIKAMDEGIATGVGNFFPIYGSVQDVFKGTS